MSSEMDRVRKGDRVKITLVGTVTSPGAVAGEEDSWRTISLAIGEDSMDASIGWDADTVAPEIEILSTSYEPGDVAMLSVGNGTELLVFRMRNLDRQQPDYWMQPTGQRYFSDFGPAKITILHRAADLIKEAP